MLHVCPRCGKYAADLSFSPDFSQAVCPACGCAYPIRRQPLFLITGASCAGKSTLSRELFSRDNGLTVLESDILWDPKWTALNDNYRSYRRLWLRVCQNVCLQTRQPAVLCGCCDPEQFEDLSEANFFTGLYYLAVVCREEVHQKRMDRRGVDDPETRLKNVAYNRWFCENAGRPGVPVTLLDTSALTPAQAADQAEEWIRNIINEEREDARR